MKHVLVRLLNVAGLGHNNNKLPIIIYTYVPLHETTATTTTKPSRRILSRSIYTNVPPTRFLALSYDILSEFHARYVVHINTSLIASLWLRLNRSSSGRLHTHTSIASPQFQLRKSNTLSHCQFIFVFFFFWQCLPWVLKCSCLAELLCSGQTYIKQ